MRIRNVLLTSAAALLCAASVPANATSLHTWVSGANGDDSTCTGARQSPCATFQKALSLTTASGIISVADPGDFGPLIILQSVTIDGGNMGSIGFGGSLTGIDVDGVSSSINVILRNLTIEGQGMGNYPIVVTSGNVNLTVDDCKLESFVTGGVFLSSAAVENVLVTNTVIDGGNIANYGVASTGVNVVALDHVTIRRALQFAVYNGVSGGLVQVTNSLLTQSVEGVYANAGTISVANTAITSNQTGVCDATGAKIRLDTNDIYDNTTAAIANCGGQIKTSGTNRTSGAILIPASLVSNSVLF